MPSLTRSGRPVCTLRSSFRTNSASGTICSVPRRISSNCSATLFTSCPPEELTTESQRTQRKTQKRGKMFLLSRLIFCFFPCVLCDVVVSCFLVIHLESADCLKGLTVMDDMGFALSFRPAQSKHVEAGGAVEKMVLLEIEQGEACEAALLGFVHRSGGTFGVL